MYGDVWICLKFEDDQIKIFPHESWFCMSVSDEC
jgi:hypothetical protein